MAKTKSVKSAEGVEVIITRKGMSVRAVMHGPADRVSELDVDTLSMRGTQRDLTAGLIRGGYKPLGRWETLAETDDGEEAARLFLCPWRGERDPLAEFKAEVDAEIARARESGVSGDDIHGVLHEAIAWVDRGDLQLQQQQEAGGDPF